VRARLAAYARLPGWRPLGAGRGELSRGLRVNVSGWVALARAGLALLAPTTFAADALSGSLPLAALALLGAAGGLAVWRPGFAVLAGLLVAAASLGALGGESALLMEHHKWLLGSLLVWLGLPVDDADRAWLVRWQLAALYGYAGLDKLERGWLDGTRPTQLLLDVDPACALVYHPVGDVLIPVVGSLVVLGQLAVPVLLARRATVGAALAFAVPFHLGVEWMFDVGTFTPVVACAWLAAIGGASAGAAFRSPVRDPERAVVY